MTTPIQKIPLKPKVQEEGAIFGVPVGTLEQAFDLVRWAANEINYTCILIIEVGDPGSPGAPPDENNPEGIPAIPPTPGPIRIRIEGRTAAPVETIVGDGDQWIVFNGGQFEVFESAEEALEIYDIVQEGV